ncbi:MAG: hypothetical protein LH606_12615 [Cytophagaceae bacterium]|nr:hypothetical protein [Cytophagaceae bacterium]
MLGTHQVFSEVPDLVESLLGINVSQSQVYRSVQTGSKLMEDPCLPSTNLQQNQDQTDKPVYGMVDGSFLCTDAGWKEIKVGRVFTATADESTPLKWTMDQSEYIAQRGHYIGFTEKFEQLLPPESRCKKVFITNGASWITNWLTTTYSDSLQILDFYHVCEKLALASQLAGCKKDWFEQQKALLLTGETSAVCSTIKQLNRFEGQVELLNYLEKNLFRMRYDDYRRKGLMISSGPIESAHRTVLQIRMKRSGQRWSDGGCDSMIKLRTAYRSAKSSLITNVLKKQAA